MENKKLEETKKTEEKVKEEKPSVLKKIGKAISYGYNPEKEDELLKKLMKGF